MMFSIKFINAFLNINNIKITKKLKQYKQKIIYFPNPQSCDHLMLLNWDISESSILYM